MKKMLMHPLAKPLVFGLALLPLAWLVFAAATDALGANPAEALIRALGDWTLRMLCLVLAVTPLRVTTGTPGLARFRRMLGLFVFFYAALRQADPASTEAWRALHRAVYAVAGLAILHFYWMRAGKNNFAEVWVYGAVLAALLGWRFWHHIRQREKSTRTGVVAVD